MNRVLLWIVWLHVHCIDRDVWKQRLILWWLNISLARWKLINWWLRLWLP